MGEGSPDYSRILAGRTYDAMVLLQNLEVAPVSFFVSASNLSKVPGAAFVDDLDEPAVSARLGGVDGKLAEILERFEKTEHLAGTVTGLAMSVTQLQVQFREQQRATEAQPTSQSTSYAKAVGRTLPERVIQLSRVNGGNRGRSPSRKRNSEQTNDGRRVPKQLKLEN